MWTCGFRLLVLRWEALYVMPDRAWTSHLSTKRASSKMPGMRKTARWTSSTISVAVSSYTKLRFPLSNLPVTQLDSDRLKVSRGDSCLALNVVSFHVVRDLATCLWTKDEKSLTCTLGFLWWFSMGVGVHAGHRSLFVVFSCLVGNFVLVQLHIILLRNEVDILCVFLLV